MPWIDTSSLDRNRPIDAERQQVYCGLDSCITIEIKQKQQAEIDNSPSAQLVYAFEMACLAPAIEMSLRGWRIDLVERDKQLADLRDIILRVQQNLDKLASVVWGAGLNPASTKEVPEFFYGAMQIPPHYSQKRGEEKKVTCDRDALEKIAEHYIFARAIVNHILKIRELRKIVSVLKAGVDDDKRLRSSFNVGATETGRWSASKNVFGTGTNAQNLSRRNRRMFVADSGKKLGVFDLQQAESYIVGAIVQRLFGVSHSAYLDACRSGDLHTYAATLIWRQLDWQKANDLKTYVKLNKKLAEQPFYREFSYRDMAKRGGHLKNYMGKNFMMAKHLKIPEEVAAAFDAVYFAAFPGIRKMHMAIAQWLMTSKDQAMTTVLGRERQFFGRCDDDHTIKEAIANEPQSVVGDVLNIALLRIWYYCREVELLGQAHDAVMFQYKETENESGILDKVGQYMLVPLDFGDFTITIPYDCKVGWNWMDYSDEENNKKRPLNLDGLKKWEGHDSRVRQFDPDRPRLDLPVSRLHGEHI